MSTLKERMNEMNNADNAIYLKEDDLINMNNQNPQTKIKVRVGGLYALIARYGFNVNRSNEINIIITAIKNSKDEKTGIEYKYTIMTVADVFRCFKDCIGDLPKSTFVKIR